MFPKGCTPGRGNLAFIKLWMCSRQRSKVLSLVINILVSDSWCFPAVSLTLAVTPLHTNMHAHTHSASLPVRMMPLVLGSAPPHPVSDGAQDWPKWASHLEEHLLHLSLKILPFSQTWAWMLFHTHRIGSVPELTAMLVSRTTKTFPVSRRWWKTTLRRLFLRTNKFGHPATCRYQWVGPVRHW